VKEEAKGEQNGEKVLNAGLKKPPNKSVPLKEREELKKRCSGKTWGKSRPARSPGGGMRMSLPEEFPKDPNVRYQGGGQGENLARPYYQVQPVGANRTFQIPKGG